MLQLPVHKEDLKRLLLIAQFERKFLICLLPLPNSVQYLVAVDQHAADERVQLERLWSRCGMRASDQTESRALTKSVSMLVTAGEGELIKGFLNWFKRWGFDISVLSCAGSASEIRVDKVPAVIWIRCSDKETIRGMILSYAAELEQGIALQTCPKFLMDTMNSIACRSAIMFGEELEDRSAIGLLQKLSICQFPFQCAHGRPSMAPLGQLI